MARRLRRIPRRLVEVASNAPRTASGNAAYHPPIAQPTMRVSPLAGMDSHDYASGRSQRKSHSSDSLGPRTDLTNCQCIVGTSAAQRTRSAALARIRNTSIRSLSLLAVPRSLSRRCTIRIICRNEVSPSPRQQAWRRFSAVWSHPSSWIRRWPYRNCVASSGPQTLKTLQLAPARRPLQTARPTINGGDNATHRLSRKILRRLAE